MGWSSWVATEQGKGLAARSPVCTFTRPPLRCRSCAHRLCVQNSRTAPFGCWTPPPSQAPVPFQKLLPLATRLCRDLGAAHLCALWDVSRLTGQKGETPCRLKRTSPSSAPSATQPPAASPRTAASTPPSESPSSLREAASDRHSHQASRSGAISARQHRHSPTPHSNLRATGSSGRMRENKDRSRHVQSLRLHRNKNGGCEWPTQKYRLLRRRDQDSVSSLKRQPLRQLEDCTRPYALRTQITEHLGIVVRYTHDLALTAHTDPAPASRRCRRGVSHPVQESHARADRTVDGPALLQFALQIVRR